jgi:hypothetical protein
LKMEPDAAAGQVIAVEGLGHFDQTAIPDCFGWTVRSRLDDGPTAVVEIDCLSVLQVAGMKAPAAAIRRVSGSLPARERRVFSPLVQLLARCPGLARGRAERRR